MMIAAVAVSTGFAAEAVASAERRQEEARADSLFEVAVEIIKKYETMHHPRHWPLVGYGHKVLPGEKFDRKTTLTESRADALLRSDLRKNMRVFRQFGRDSMILGVLAYNIGMGNVMRSSIVKKLRECDRDIRDIYISYNRYRGKTHKQIKRRRIEEFDRLFITDTHIANTANTVKEND